MESLIFKHFLCSSTSTAMAKDTLFRAYDLNRKNPHQIASPPTKISEHRLRREEWAAPTRRSTAKSRRATKETRWKTKKAAKKKVPKRAIDILRCELGETQCLQCTFRSLALELRPNGKANAATGGAFDDDPSCGTKCYRQFRKGNLSRDLVDIKGPSVLGYGAFTKPSAKIVKGQWIGEYIGELRPFEAEASPFRFEIPGVGVVDSERAGNWTRFINSHCRPNVKPW